MNKQEKIIQEVVKFLEFGPGEESYIREKFRAFVLSVLPEEKIEPLSRIKSAEELVNLDIVDQNLAAGFNQAIKQTKQAIKEK